MTVETNPRTGVVPHKENETEPPTSPTIQPWLEVASGILLAAGLGKWGRWVLFAVFFSLRVAILWMYEVFKAVH